MPRPRKSNNSNNSKKPQKKKEYKKRYRKKWNNSSNMIISRPLLPQTQKVGMRYTTRIQINPNAVESGAADSAHTVQTYSLSWNNLNDIDQTSVAVTHAMDGARNHQPRMYDEYAVFYNKITAIGAKAKFTFLNSDRVITQYMRNEHGVVTGSLDHVVGPIPCYVGYLNSQYADNSAVSEKFDNLNEKNEIRYKRLCNPDKPVSMTAKWSLNKEPSRKYGLQLESSQMSDDWGSQFNHDLVATQRRYIHLFAHPITTQEHRSGLTTDTSFKDPEVIDVQVEMDIICVLSDRKEVSQSH